MDMSNICMLVSTTYETDKYKVRHEIVTKRTVFCRVRSVSGTEWHEAGRNGIKAQYQITLFKYDYNNEKKVSLKDKEYTVYRTYENGDYIELYLEARANNG